MKKAETIIPRPEYPRPDFQRGTAEGIDWITLNGTWGFAFDANDTGEEEEWFAKHTTDLWNRAGGKQIQVPYPWESLAAWGEEADADNATYLSKNAYLTPEDVTCGGMTRDGNYREAPRHTIGWYRKTVSIPNTWEGKRVILTFGAVDWHAKVWVNGQYVGEHENGYLPFEFDITDALTPTSQKTSDESSSALSLETLNQKPPTRAIEQRQTNPASQFVGAISESRLASETSDEIYRAALDETGILITPQGMPKNAHIVVRVYDAQEHGEQPVGKQANWYARTSGIWQTVYLEPRSATYIKQCHITPDIDNATADFAVKLNGDLDEGMTLHWKCGELSGNVAAAETLQFVVNIPPEQLHLWDVETPHLYDVTLTLMESGNHSAPTVIDRVYTYFGMRKVSIAKAPGGDYQYIYLNNRPVYLLGALNQSFNPQGVYTFLTDEAIRRDVERAKEFGFNFLRLHIKVDEPRLYYWADKLGLLFMCDIPNFSNYTEKAKARFEETLRGNIARDYNHPAIISWCNFNETWGLGGQEYKRLSSRQEWVREMYHLAKSLDSTRIVEDNSPCLYDHVETDINSWHFYINDYARAKEHIAHVVAQTYPGSTFNYTGDNAQTDAPLINSEYGGIGAGAGDKDVSWCFKYLTNELRIHPKICGYVYTELQDIEWEHNGFMNYDRSVKEFGYDYRDINTLDFIAIDYPPGTTVAPRDNIKAAIYTSHFSHKTIKGTTLHWQLDTLESNGHLTRGRVSGNVDIPFPQYQVQHVHSLELNIPDVESSVGTLHIWVSDERGAVVARNFINFEIFAEATDSVGGGLPNSDTLCHLPGDITDSQWDSGCEVTEQLLSAQGCGYAEYKIPLPTGVASADIAKMTLVFEASASNGEARQTEPQKYPSDVTISVNGVEIETVTLPDCPADARGVLSYIHGHPGIYGYLCQVELHPARVSTTDTLTVRYEVKADAENRGGFALYGNRLGRYPTAPHIIITQS